jgi:glyceraldehyde 3-phosphate dehydrogenase
MGRSAPTNLAPASTGAAIDIIKALPQFEGRFDGIAIRTPVPVGCISDITFISEKDMTVTEINPALKEEANTGKYKQVASISSEPLVSSDIIKSSWIIDLQMTRVVHKNLLKIMAWYDNEMGAYKPGRTSFVKFIK